MNKLTIYGKQQDFRSTTSGSLYLNSHVDAYPSQAANIADVLQEAATFMGSLTAHCVKVIGEVAERHYWRKHHFSGVETYAVQREGVTTITRATGEKLIVQEPVRGRRAVGYGWNTWTFQYDGTPALLDDVAGFFWGQDSRGYGPGGTESVSPTELVWGQSASCD